MKGACRRVWRSAASFEGKDLRGQRGGDSYFRHREVEESYFRAVRHQVCVYVQLLNRVQLLQPHGL